LKSDNPITIPAIKGDEKMIEKIKKLIEKYEEYIVYYDRELGLLRKYGREMYVLREKRELAEKFISDLKSI